MPALPINMYKKQLELTASAAGGSCEAPFFTFEPRAKAWRRQAQHGDLPTAVPTGTRKLSSRRGRQEDWQAGKVGAELESFPWRDTAAGAKRSMSSADDVMHHIRGTARTHHGWSRRAGPHGVIIRVWPRQSF